MAEAARRQIGLGDINTDAESMPPSAKSIEVEDDSYISRVGNDPLDRYARQPSVTPHGSTASSVVTNEAAAVPYNDNTDLDQPVVRPTERVVEPAPETPHTYVDGRKRPDPAVQFPSLADRSYRVTPPTRGQTEAVSDTNQSSFIDHSDDHPQPYRPHGVETDADDTSPTIARSLKGDHMIVRAAGAIGSAVGAFSNGFQHGRSSRQSQAATPSRLQLTRGVDPTSSVMAGNPTDRSAESALEVQTEITYAIDEPFMGSFGIGKQDIPTPLRTSIGSERVTPIPPEDIRQYIPDLAGKIFDDSVDPMIAVFPAGRKLREFAIYRALAAFDGAADEVADSNADLSPRLAKRMPNLLARERNVLTLQAANAAPAIGLAKVVQPGITKAEATEKAFKLLGDVEVFHSDIDGCMVAYGDTVTGTIEDQSHTLKKLHEKPDYLALETNNRPDTVLARTDVYSKVTRPDSEGHTYASYGVVAADDKANTHYLYATRPLGAPAPGRHTMGGPASHVVNEVAAVALNPRVVSAVLATMLNGGNRQELMVDGVRTEVTTNHYEDLYQLNAFIGDPTAIGTIDDEPDEPITPLRMLEASHTVHVISED